MHGCLDSSGPRRVPERGRVARVACLYADDMSALEPPPRPFGRVLTAMVTAVPRRRLGRPRGHRAGSPSTSSTTATTASSSPARRGSRRPPAPRRTARSCAPSSRRSATGRQVVAGRRHQQHRALGRARRAGREARRRRRAARDAVLQQAHARTGVLAHFRGGRRRASDLPVMLYDIPGRTGITIADDTYRRVAEHDRIVAVKDAVGDLYRGVRLMARDRPGVLLRRRRAQPRLADPRRLRRRLRRRPRRR